MVAAIRRLPTHLAALWRNDRRQLLHEALLAFLLAGFGIGPEPLWADLFYVLILPLALHVAWRQRHDFRWRAIPLHIALGGGLILWFAITLIWDERAHAAPVSLWLWFWAALCTFVFVLALQDALTSSASYRRRLQDGMIAAATCNALLSLILFLGFAVRWGSDPSRMAGWTETRHPILGAIIMGIAVLLAAERALTTRRWRYAAAVGIGLAFIALTGSRGPALATLVALALLVAGCRPKAFLVTLAAAAIVAGGMALLDPAMLARIAASVTNRGDSHRLIIWQLSWHDILLRPLLAHGPAYRLDRPGEAFPHNLFLSTWLYSGLIGLMLLLAYLAAVLRQALQAPARPNRMFNLTLLVLVLVSATTEFGQVIKGPGPMWYMFWLGTLIYAASGTAKPAFFGRLAS